MSTAESVRPCSGDRPKHLTRVASGRLLDLAMLRAGVTQEQVARAWGVAAPTVRAVREGRKPLTEERLSRLPLAVYDEYMRVRGEQLGRVWTRLPDVANRAATHETLAAYSRDTSETMQALAMALADGELSAEERREIAAELREDIELASGVLRALEDE